MFACRPSSIESVWDSGAGPGGPWFKSATATRWLARNILSQEARSYTAAWVNSVFHPFRVDKLSISFGLCKGRKGDVSSQLSWVAGSGVRLLLTSCYV